MRAAAKDIVDILSNHSAITPLMVVPSSAIDLPLESLVWEDANQISYNNSPD